MAYLMVPERIFSFPRAAPDQFLLVIFLYPFLSVLGQEIAYRLLFFERCGDLITNRTVATILSVLVFAVAHAFYRNWVAVIRSFGGGLTFAWSYVRTSYFLLLWILHSLVGQILFASGLGIFFYHGEIS